MSRGKRRSLTPTRLSHSQTASNMFQAARWSLVASLLTLVVSASAFSIHHVASGLALLSDGTLILGPNQNASDPLTVANALQTDAPLIDPGQLLRDLTPQVNTSPALDCACDAIQLSLPDNEFFGRTCVDQNCISLTLPAQQLIKIYHDWQKLAFETSGTYVQNALSFSVVTNTALEAHHAAGGNAMGLGELTEGFLWVFYGTGSVPAIGTLTDTRLYATVANTAEASVPKSGRGLP